MSTSPASALPAAPPPSRWRQAASAVIHDPVMLGSLLLLLLLVALTVGAPLLASHDPGALTPRARLQGSSDVYWLGTDSLGRDLLSRVLYGGRLSITLAALVSLIAIVAGLVIGLAAGYVRRLDAPVMRLMDGIMAIPGLLLAVAMVALGGANIVTMVIAISIPRFRAWRGWCAASCCRCVKNLTSKPRSVPARRRSRCCGGTFCPAPSTRWWCKPPSSAPRPS